MSTIFVSIHDRLACGMGRQHERVRVDAEVGMSGRFVTVDRHTVYLLSPAVQE